MPVPRRALSLAILLTVALPLAACGGSDETTESSARTSAEAPPATAIQYGEYDRGEPVVAPERQAKAKAKDHEASAAGGEESMQKKRGRSDSRGSEADRSAGGDTSPPAREAKRPPECPKALTAKQCAEAGQTYEKSGASSPVPTDECPPALDAAACAEAGKAYEEAENGSREVQPNECPRAMTAEECRQAGEAYAEATR